ncbi:hypothetical protein BS50DRAFT_507415, partial [Corynespora cassiicola Philippines]
HLISLGLPQSLTPAVWIAGPICGLLVQPLFGAFSDRFESRWGRRKPFILGGAIATATSITGLAWVNNVVELARILLFPNLTSEACRIIRCSLAVAWVWMLNISIQPIQIGTRSLIFESCHARGQVRASAWTGKATAMGSVSGYLLSSFDLTIFLNLEIMTPFQALCAAVSTLLVLSSAVTCSCVSHRIDPLAAPRSDGYLNESQVTVKKIVHVLLSLPEVVSQLFVIQFYSWMAWFPFIYYQTGYLSDLYVSETPLPHQWMTQGALSIIREDGIRAASRSALGFAVVSLVAATALPFITQKTLGQPRTSLQPRHKFFQRLSIPSLWICGHVWLATAMISCFLIRHIAQANIVIALVGIPWALQAWIPYAILGETIACDEAAYVGVLTSLHNAFISAPQILSAGICAIVFHLYRLMGQRGEVGLAIGLGGLASIGAACQTVKLRRFLIFTKSREHPERVSQSCSC